MELNIFNAHPRFSDRFGTAILTDTINDVMAAADRSGRYAAEAGASTPASGTRSETPSDNPDFSGILPTGWIPWIERPSSRSDLDRENRIGRFNIWIAPADAINEVIGSVTLSGG